MKNRDFKYRGIAFHLDDNIYKNGFENKYRLLWFNVAKNNWQYIGTCNTMAKAKQIAKDFF